MNEEERLQEQLEKLEAGERLEAAQAEPGEETAELLRFAAALRELPRPRMEPETVASQRAGLLRLAVERNRRPLDGWPLSEKPAIVASLTGWLRARTTFEWVAAALVAPAMLILIIAFLMMLLSPGGAVDDGLSGKTEDESLAQISPVATMPGAEVADSAAGSGADVTAGEAPVASPVEEGGADPNGIFMPLLSNPGRFDPGTASLYRDRGIVEVQGEGEEWAVVDRMSTVSGGQRLRTGPMSAATITFFDGSQAHLGPETEISFEEVEALPPEEGFRTVVMTQWRGESEHDVNFRNDAGSRYEVKSPAGSGIARGTTFEVSVVPDEVARYSVTEGRVDVTAAGVTVRVGGGRTTSVPDGSTPTSPAFQVTGEGRVTETGDIWIIGGQSFATDEHTLIVGDPQVGDVVYVEGRLLSDGTRLAERIILLERARDNRFQLKGEVEAIGAESWIVAGQTISVTGQTEVDEAIAAGDTVLVSGAIGEDGALLAERIVRVEEEPGTPFHFVGLVEAIGDASWTISGRAVAVDENTEIEEGLEVGDLAAVRGRILEDGTWLASGISLAEEEAAAFSISGTVESIDPWRVAGISFETRPWTIIEPGIEMGDRVRVSGRILDDGVWVAALIEELEDEEEHTVILVGIVDSIDPWVVNGLPLVVDENTVIVGEIEVGTLVWVEIELRPDGTWIARRIVALDEDDELSCFTVHAVVSAIDGDIVHLRDWPAITLDDDIEIEGDMTPGSTIAVYICFDVDGDIVVVGDIIIVIIHIVIGPPPPADDGTGDTGEGGGKVTICHYPGGNPGNRHTITVGLSAWYESHRNHGDTLGPCP
jgi:hypothetical protein